MTKFARKKFNNEKERRSFKQRRARVNFGPATIGILLFGLILFVGFSYLYYINQTATGGFDIKGIENRIEELAKKNKQLDLHIAELQSLSNIEKASAELNMVATTSIEYVSAAGSAVAVR